MATSFENAQYPPPPPMPDAFVSAQEIDHTRFAKRQGCPSVKTDDGNWVVFENGAGYRCFDALRNMHVLDCFIEPTVDDNNKFSLDRRLLYAETAHRREVLAFKNYQGQLALQSSQRLAGLSVPEVPREAVESLRAGKVRCDVLAAKVAALKAKIAELPEVIAAQKLRETQEAEHRARLASENALRAEIMRLGVELPQDLAEKGKAKQALHG